MKLEKTRTGFALGKECVFVRTQSLNPIQRIFSPNFPPTPLHQLGRKDRWDSLGLSSEEPYRPTLVSKLWRVKRLLSDRQDFSMSTKMKFILEEGEASEYSEHKSTLRKCRIWLSMPRCILEKILLHKCRALLQLHMRVSYFETPFYTQAVKFN